VCSMRLISAAFCIRLPQAFGNSSRTQATTTQLWQVSLPLCALPGRSNDKPSIACANAGALTLSLSAHSRYQANDAHYLTTRSSNSLKFNDGGDEISAVRILDYAANSSPDGTILIFASSDGVHRSVCSCGISSCRAAIPQFADPSACIPGGEIAFGSGERTTRENL
jgi:hypothetical protein